MSDGSAFFLLLLIGIAVSGWLGFCIGDGHGWRNCVRRYGELIEEQRGEADRPRQ